MTYILLQAMPTRVHHNLAHTILQLQLRDLAPFLTLVRASSLDHDLPLAGLGSYNRLGLLLLLLFLILLLLLLIFLLFSFLSFFIFSFPLLPFLGVLTIIN